MKKILFCLVIIMGLFTITGCGKNKINKTDISKQAKVLDWDTVYNELSLNGAKATDYNGHWFIFSGMVSNINENYCYMSLRYYQGLPLNPISIYLDNSELKELKNGQIITVVGKFDRRSSFTSLTNAFIVQKELYNDQNIQTKINNSLSYIK